MVQKRLYKKTAGLKNETEPPASFNAEKADLVLVGFGSTFGAIKEAVEATTDKNVGFVHLPQVWPFPSENLTRLLKSAKKIVTVENNASAQLARLIKTETDIKIEKSILKFDGRPFDLDFLTDSIKKEI